MNNFLIYKAKITKFYKDYETWFQIIFKFLVAFCVFGFVNSSLGYFEALDNLGVQTVLALISAIVPSSIFVLLVAVLSLLHLYKLSLIMMALAFVMFIVFYFLYLKFAPRHGVLMVVIPVLMPWNLHFIVPLIAGLFYNPFTLVPVGCCFIMMNFVKHIIEAAPMVEGASLDVVAIVDAYKYVIDSVLANKEMLLYAAVFAVVILLTYVVSRLPFDYSWYVGIGLGTLAAIVGMLVGSGMYGVEISSVGVIFGALISGVIIAVIQFLHCTVDYSKKEFVQFEDDDYFYYVRAIPKIAAPESEKAGYGHDSSIILNDAQADVEIPVEDDEVSEDSLFGLRLKGSLDQFFGNKEEQPTGDTLIAPEKPEKKRPSFAERFAAGKKEKDSKQKAASKKSEKEKPLAEDSVDDLLDSLNLSDEKDSFDNAPIPSIIPEVKAPAGEGTAARPRRERTLKSARASVSPAFDVDSFDDDGYDDSLVDYDSEAAYDSVETDSYEEADEERFDYEDL